jgi:hypothetical protein
MSLAQRTEGTVYRQAVQPHWLPGDTRFWYKVTTGPQSIEWIEVDAEAGTRKPLVDSIRLAQALTRATGKPVLDAGFLDLGQPDVTADTVSFFTLGKHWNWSRTAGTLTEDPRPEPSLTPIPAESRRARSRDGGSDTKLTFVKNSPRTWSRSGVQARPARTPDGRLRPGQEREQHTFSGHVWAVTDLIRNLAGTLRGHRRARARGGVGNPATGGSQAEAIRRSRAAGQFRHRVAGRQMVRLNPRSQRGHPYRNLGTPRWPPPTDGNAEHSYRSDLVWLPIPAGWR